MALSKAVAVSDESIHCTFASRHLQQSLTSESLRLATLLVEMKEGLDLVRSKVQLLAQKVKENFYSTKDGISYLDVKYLLLLSYCQSIVYYLLRKAEGSSIQGHPVTNYLVEIRLFLEKIRPIDKKHQYLIEKLSRVDTNVSAQVTASKNEGNFNIHPEDALKYRPNPDMLVSKLDPVAQDGEGIYRPPMFAPTAMDEEKDSRDKKLQIRKQKEMLHKASRSAFVKELANNLEGKPDEVREIVGAESKEMLREQSKLLERARQEEELFTRVPLSRIEKKKIKHLKRSRNGLLGLMDDFNDDISGLIGMEKTDGSDNHSRRQKEGSKKLKKCKNNKLSNLMHLYRWNNKFSGSQINYKSMLPGYLWQISTGRNLSLNNNRVTGDILRQFLNLTCLLTLNLTHNFLSGQIPKEVPTILVMQPKQVLRLNPSFKLIPKQAENMSNKECQKLTNK